ncbi:hypothetical protein E2C01_086983 [Portunus trituberculatus]|uniref:Uncharacterized protein n=1 Tax=Portunus trituberculatus TaxID=210409 RepID=A0A5B7J289_PORTR|nr:hypothetical protein [Portunus trituberculatus]
MSQQCSAWVSLAGRASPVGGKGVAQGERRQEVVLLVGPVAAPVARVSLQLTPARMKTLMVVAVVVALAALTQGNK